MNDSSAIIMRPAVPSEVQLFAAEKALTPYMNAVVQLARQAFPSSDLTVALDQDAEDESHRYIALDVDVADRTPQELLAGQRIWSEGIGDICPSRHAVYFVLGWR
jgi:hypothetical protein